jgi:hypothetical protein
MKNFQLLWLLTKKTAMSVYYYRLAVFVTLEYKTHEITCCLLVENPVDW